MVQGPTAYRGQAFKAARSLPRTFKRSLIWENLASAYVVSSEPYAGSKKISLQAFSQDVVSRCSLNTFFGEKLLEVAPWFANE